MVTLRYGKLLIICLLVLLSSSSIAAEGITIVGKIESGRYYAVDESFNVRLPVSGTQLQLAAISVTITVSRTILTITPADATHTYRLEISLAAPDPDKAGDFSSASKQAFDWYTRLASRLYKAPLVELYTEEYRLGEFPAARAIFKQFAEGDRGPRYHLFFLADFGETISFVWADIPLQQEDLAIEDAIIMGTDPVAINAQKFFNSVRIK